MDIANENQATTSLLHPSYDSKHQEDLKRVPPWLECASCMIHLAVFGILGVITRYMLQKVFGPQGIGVTSDETILYLDLPSNIIGSFLMGWLGVVFKTEIANVSDQLSLGLSTGYLGSLTTFSGWNQKMLDLSVKGHWTFAILGFLLGFFLVAYSIILGKETAKGFRWLIQSLEKSADSGIPYPRRVFRVDTLWRHIIVIIVMLSIWVVLWALSTAMETREFSSGESDAQLWLGCLVGPFGVWIRWWLARFNGRGLGNNDLWRWLPFGTVMANVFAAFLMAALATLKKVVNNKASVTVFSGIQLGFLGCLSTVSTMMLEFESMRVSNHPWRAYAYILSTIGLSFGLGTLIYSVPIWVQGYE